MIYIYDLPFCSAKAGSSDKNQDELCDQEAANCPDILASLQMFQKQRLFHTRKLKREMKKLEKMEQEIALRTAQINIPPEPKPRQCWAQSEVEASGHVIRPPKRTPRRRDSQQSSVNGEEAVQTTTFRAQATSKESHKPPGGHKRTNYAKINMVRSMTGSMSDSTCSMTSSVSSACSWFIPSEEEPANNTRAIQTGSSLLKHYRERKDKGCIVRDRPQAYFLACDKPEVPKSNSPKTSEIYAEVQTGNTVLRRRISSQRPVYADAKVIDLETETLPAEQNLQEALRRKRPDYIQRTKDREQDRMARSFVAANKANVTSSTTAAAKVYNPVKAKSRIPRSSTTLQEKVYNTPSVPRLAPNTTLIYSKKSLKGTEETENRKAREQRPSSGQKTVKEVKHAKDVKKSKKPSSIVSRNNK